MLCKVGNTTLANIGSACGTRPAVTGVAKHPVVAWFKSADVETSGGKPAVGPSGKRAGAPTLDETAGAPTLGERAGATTFDGKAVETGGYVGLGKRDVAVTHETVSGSGVVDMARSVVADGVDVVQCDGAHVADTGAGDAAVMDVGDVPDSIVGDAAAGAAVDVAVEAAVDVAVDAAVNVTSAGSRPIEHTAARDAIPGKLASRVCQCTRWMSALISVPFRVNFLSRFRFSRRNVEMLFGRLRRLAGEPSCCGMATASEIGV